MNEQYKHKCLKCTEEYTDDDPEPFYCAKCVEERKAIAKEVDRKMEGILTRGGKSDLQIFNEIARMRGSGSHVSIKDLGITL